MGAGISLDEKNSTATVIGVKSLHGASVTALDLRAGAAMVIAGLAAEGNSLIDEAHHIFRGYDHLPEKLRALGADISLL